MKYRLLGMGMAALMLVLVAAAALLERSEPVDYGRVHQHLTARRDTGCGCGGSQLCSHLPLVIIDTGGQEIPGQIMEDQRDRFGQPVYTKAPDGESTILAQIKVIDNQDANNHPGDEPAYSASCRFRVRGNSSRSFPKQPYLVQLVDEEGENRDLPLLGMGAHHEWALHGPSLDKSLVRNYMWYNIAGEIMEYAPNCRYCEVVLNGEYQGIYLLAETSTAGEGCRLNLRMNIKNAQASGYLIRCDRPVEEDLETLRDIHVYSERTNENKHDFAIRYPGKNILTPELAKDIELDYSAFEKALYSFDYNSPEYGYRKWIDTGNFVDYYLLNEFTRNVDAGRYSTYLYKELGQPFRLCVWDFNNSCDNYREGETAPESFTVQEWNWFLQLFMDQDFVEQVIRRYGELRGTYLSDAYMVGYIRDTLDYLGPAVERNNERWPVDMPGEHHLEPEGRNPDTFEEAVADLQTWLLARGEWVDESIHALRQYAHPSRHKQYQH